MLFPDIPRSKDMSFDELLAYMASDHCVYKQNVPTHSEIGECNGKIWHYTSHQHIITYRHMPEQWWKDQAWAEENIQLWEHKLARLEYRAWELEQIYLIFSGKSTLF